MGESLTVRRFLPRLPTAVVITAAVFAVLASLAVGWSAAPLNTADETAHLDYAIGLWHGHLPVFEQGLAIRPPFGIVPPVQWVAQHPPLFYALVAPVVGPLWDGGHPYAAVLAGRSVNALLAGGAVLATGFAGFRVVPRRPAVGAVAAIVIACTSMLLLVGGAVYNDLPNTILAALAIAVGATALRRGLSTRLVVVAGVVTGLGMLSRASFAVFVVAVVVALVLAARSGSRSAPGSRFWDGWGRLVAAAVAALVPVLAAGWFYLRNIALTGNAEGSHPEWAAEHLHRHTASASQVLTDHDFWTGLFSVFLGHLAEDGAWTWLLLLGPLALALAAAVVGIVRRAGRGSAGRGSAARGGATPARASSTRADWLVAAMLAAVVLLVVVAQVRFTMSGGSAHARYLLAVMPVLAIPMAIGLTGFGRIASSVLTVVWTLPAAWVWFAILDLQAPVAGSSAVLVVARVVTVLAVVVLALTLVLTVRLLTRKAPGVLR